MEAGWADQPLEEEQLYDLLLDPNECRNRAGDPDCAEVLANMRGRLEAWMRRTADPLLDGPVPAPPGALVNDPDGISPREAPRPVTTEA
jgi:hypothetical protein